MAKRSLLRAHVAFLLFTLSLGSFAQSPPIERPALQIGDRWIFETSDPYTKARKGTLGTQVIAINGDQVSLRWGSTETATATTDLTVLDTPRVSNDVGYRFLKFPLAVGDQWSFKTKWKNKRLGTNGTTELEVVALAREPYTTPDGTFDSIKLRASGNMYIGSDLWRLTITYWYAPEAKQIVRLEWRDHKRDMDYDQTLILLMLAK